MALRCKKEQYARRRITPGKEPDMKHAAIAAVMTTLTLAACHSPQQVASNPTPQPSPDSTAPVAVARDTAPARPAELSDAERQRLHADSVRAQVKGEMSNDAPGTTSWGLPMNDSTRLADRLHFDYH